MSKFIPAVCFVLFAMLSSAARADDGVVVLNFDDLAAGTVLSNQYEQLGAVFRANAFNGSGSSSSGEPWARNTDVTVTALASLGVEAGAMEGPFASGNVLRSYNAWLDEDGDPSFEVLFADPVQSFSASFSSVSTEGRAAADTRIFLFNGDSLLGIVSGDPGALQSEFLLSFAAPAITRVVLAPGSYNDWVAVDNLSFTLPAPVAAAVPEPDPSVLLLTGLGAIVLMRRNRTANTSKL